jgi:hypothetical protein
MPSRLPPLRTHQSRAPSLAWRSGRHLQRYYGLLGLPPGTAPFHHRLMGTAFARRRPPGRVSPVPRQTVATCPPPYPGSVLCPSGRVRLDPVAARGYWDPRGSTARSLLPSTRHDGLGRSFLSEYHVTRLQGSRFRIGPAVLLPSAEGHTAIRGLSTLRSGEGIFPRTRSLLHGAPALTVAGLPPASRTQHGTLFALVPSGRTMASSL